MRIIGVTGTNGKTTCVHLICHLLKQYLHCASFGTLGIKYYLNNRSIETKTKLTTLANPELIQNLSKGSELGCELIAMEASSHGLVQGRVSGIPFDTAIFTNLSHDHLDYHHSMENYFAAKTKLFTEYGSHLTRAIINLDNQYGIRLIKLLLEYYYKHQITCEIIGFSAAPLHTHYGELDLNLIKTITCEKIAYTNKGIVTKIISPWGEGSLECNLLGIHNLSNLLASIAACSNKELTWEQLLINSLELTPPPGRLERVLLEQPDLQPKVFIDYAHTPNGLECALFALTMHYPGAKICCIFGCGGDRDPSKRSQMLQIAEKYCNIIVVTQDNPRNEDPNKILADILQHKISSPEVTLIIEPDRKQAIYLAIKNYAKEYIILIAGKGHETTQIIGTQEHFFCDYTFAKSFLTEIEA